jgi:hypothetical protein
MGETVDAAMKHYGAQGQQRPQKLQQTTKLNVRETMAKVGDVAAAATAATAKQIDRIEERRKELLGSSKVSELRKMARQLGAGDSEIETAEDSDSPKVRLVELVILSETTAKVATPYRPTAQTSPLIHAAVPDSRLAETNVGITARPPPSLQVAWSASDTSASEAAGPLLALVSTEGATPTMDDATAAGKMQAVFRGKQGRAEAVEERETVSNQRRLKDLRNSIMLKQATLTASTVAAILVTVILPVYTTQGPDIDFGVTFAFWFTHLGCGCFYLMNAVFSLALGDTGMQYSGRVVLLLSLISFVGFTLWLGDAYPFYNPMEPDNTEADVRLIKGTAGTILSYVGLTWVIVLCFCGPQWYQLFLLRHVKIPPAKLMTWWQMSRESPGMLVGTIAVQLYFFFDLVYIEILPTYRWHTMESFDEYKEWKNSHCTWRAWLLGWGLAAAILVASLDRFGGSSPALGSRPYKRSRPPGSDVAC